MEKKKVSLKYLIEGMAFSRSVWIDKARRRLEGALGEYAKIKLNELVSVHFDWTREVTELLEKVRELFDPAKTKTKTNFDLNKAFAEAVREASQAQEQIVDAKNDFVRRYLDRDQAQEFLSKMRYTKLRSEDLTAEMLETLAPDLADRLK